MISEIGPKLSTSFFRVPKFNVVVHLKSPTMFLEDSKNSNPRLFTCPTLLVNVLNPGVWGTGGSRSRSFVVFKYYSIVPSILPFNNPKSIPKLVCSDVSHFRSGLGILAGATAVNNVPPKTLLPDPE